MTLSFKTLEQQKFTILFIYLFYVEKFRIEGEKELQTGRIANEKYQYVEAFSTIFN